MSNNIELRELRCSYNQLTTLDVFNNTELTRLSCRENQLTSLDVSRNNQIIILDIGYMPGLDKVCVWGMPFPPEGVSVSTYDSPNVYFSTDCSK